jgi:DDE superfamily endonuclease/Helix-turn-helix of DDE superfamily endonuclease
MAIPSVFSFRPQPSTQVSDRTARSAKRALSVIDTDNKHQPFSESSNVDVEEVSMEVEIACCSQQPATSELDSTSSVEAVEAAVCIETVNCGVQCTLLQPFTCRMSFEQLASDPVALQFYTSFENEHHFNMFFEILGPAVPELKKFSTLPNRKDQLLLTLIKLRQAKEDYELSLMFSVSTTTVSDILTIWINFMYFQLHELDLWPKEEVFSSFMPLNFGRMFPSTKLIIDATEIPIQKPCNADAQSATWSTYKNRNTVKTVVGCTPRGAVAYVSDSYGGSVSDRQILERSTLLSDCKLLPGSSIMADRGIMIQDLFAPHNVQVNTPHMLKGKHQLSETELVFDRRIASKRIHIERVIGLSKTFKILQKELKGCRVALSGRIIFVCFMITNFRTSILNKWA